MNVSRSAVVVQILWDEIPSTLLINARVAGICVIQVHSSFAFLEVAFRPAPLPVPASIQAYLYFWVDIAPLVGPDLGKANVRIHIAGRDPWTLRVRRTLVCWAWIYQVEYERGDERIGTIH